MKIFQSNENDRRHNVFFNELETSNLKKIFGKENINIENICLCSYIERYLKKHYKEHTEDKRVMVTDITSNENFISAQVTLQDINLPFKIVKEKNNFLKVTEIVFESNTDLEKFKSKGYKCRIIEGKKEKTTMIIFNMKQSEEIKIARYNGRIVYTCNVLEYILFYKLAEYIKFKFKEVRTY